MPLSGGEGSAPHWAQLTPGKGRWVTTRPPPTTFFHLANAGWGWRFRPLRDPADTRGGGEAVLMRPSSHHLPQSYHCQVGLGAQLTPGPTTTTPAGESEMLLVSGAGAASCSALHHGPAGVLEPRVVVSGMGMKRGLRVVSDQIPVSLRKPQGWHVAFPLVWLEEEGYSPKGVLLLGNTSSVGTDCT